MYRFITLFFLALFALSACSHYSNTIDNENYETMPDSIDFEVIAQDQHSGIFEEQPTLYQITAQNDWESFWATHATPDTPLPVIDFDQEMVIAVIDQYQPSAGYSLDITNIVANNDALQVYVTRNQPGESCFNASVISQPAIIAKLPKDMRMSELNLSTENYECNDQAQAFTDLPST